jgi:hypothetical protein
MAIRRITISVPEELALRIKEAAGDMPVSQYVTEVLEKELDENELEHQWNLFQQSLEVDDDSEARATEMFERLVLSRNRDGAA